MDDGATGVYDDLGEGSVWLISYRLIGAHLLDTSRAVW